MAQRVEACAGANPNIAFMVLAQRTHPVMGETVGAAKMERWRAGRQHEKTFIQCAGQENSRARFEQRSNGALRAGKTGQLHFPAALMKFFEATVDHGPNSSFARLQDRLIKVCLGAPFELKGRGFASFEGGDLPVGRDPELTGFRARQ